MPTDRGGSPPDDLARLAVRGVDWKLRSMVVVQVLAIASTVVLARLLTPRDLGLAAMALVFSSLVFVLSDFALGAALVQRDEITEADRSTAFWTSAAIGIVLTLVSVALAGPVAALYGEPSVAPLFRVLSLSFLFTALGTTQGALLTRNLQFRALELRTMVATVAGVAVAIVVAALGSGPWALIAQQVAATGISTALLWGSSRWRPRLVFSRASLRVLGSFSALVSGGRVLFYLNRNVDNFLVGRYLGPSALGAYSLAYNIMLTPLNRLAAPVQQVMFPALSRIRDPVRIGDLWLRASRVVAAIAVPGLVGLAIVAPEFVEVVLGPRWHDVTRVLQILTWVALLQTLQGQNAGVLQALGRGGTLFRFAAVATVVSIAAYAAGLPWGIVGVATAYAIAMTFLEPLYLWLTGRAVGVSARRFLASLRGVLEASAAMGVGVLGGKLLLLSMGVAPAARLVILAVIGVALFLPLCAWRAPEVFDEVRRAFKQWRAEPAAPRQEPAETVS